MKKIEIFICALLLTLIGTANAYDEIFFDNFNDGNTDGWVLSQKGNWKILDEKLAQVDQPSGEDWVMGLVENLVISDQIIEVEVSTVGYGGIVFWYQDKWNYVGIVVYPYSSGLYLLEKYNGVETVYHYGFRTWHTWWYDLKVDVNSVTGQLDIYIDGTFIFTYQATTQNRTGQSGVTFGNGGASFDDFKITYSVCDADYDGDGRVGIKDRINKRKDLVEQAVHNALEEFNYWKEHCWLSNQEAE
jgi:hypothetical protein